MDVYLAGALGGFSAPQLQKAADLANKNLHQAVLRSLSLLGETEILTDENVGDVSCVYRVSGPEDLEIEVFVFTLLPYAALLLKRGGLFAGYVDRDQTGWAAEVRETIGDHGIMPLPEEVCIADSPVMDIAQGVPLSYFELLFASEIDTPGKE